MHSRFGSATDGSGGRPGPRICRTRRRKEAPGEARMIVHFAMAGHSA
jgi:hypothetical protein